MNTVELQQRFLAAQRYNEFFAAQAMWDTNQARAIVFSRPAWRSREAAYSVAMYLPNDGAYVAVERSLDTVLAVMHRHGYTDEQWQCDGQTYHDYIAPIDQDPLWNADYGVIRQSGLQSKVTFKPETITISVQKDGGEPFKQDREAHVAYMDGKRVGLAYLTNTDEDGELCYGITHLASGLDVCTQYSVGDEKAVQKWIELCLEFADWTGEKPRLTSTKHVFKYAVIGALHEA
ncbi:MAG TPA: hypothetical protein VHL10_03055 [Nitrososphaera sp.]|jgi:hypothetical protein|nr:hypothetical protein [Nitrososphaera sp.]